MAFSSRTLAVLSKRSSLIGVKKSYALTQCSYPMSTSATDEMKKFWEKNISLKRPNSPWIIYEWHFPMLTSLGHRTTGLIMGLSLYGIGMGIGVAPGDAATYVEFIKGLHIPTAALFAAKSLVAFPLCYHYLNGIRHLSWDAGFGYELKTQYMTGAICYASAALLALLLGSIAYW